MVYRVVKIKVYDQVCSLKQVIIFYSIGTYDLKTFIYTQRKKLLPLSKKFQKEDLKKRL